MDIEPKPNDIQFLIGPYQVLKSIGRGGLGEVYLVYDPVNHRKVALKRMVRMPGDDSLRTQFLSEAHMLAQLDHLNIVSFYDLTEEKDQIYFTMFYVEGETLEVRMKKARQREIDRKPPIMEESVPLFVAQFLKICKVMDYACSKGMIHRDLKPSNIMVDLQGEVHLLDWGLAMPYVERETAPSEKAKTVSGTTIYLAPEMILGDPSSLQTEMYALGLILYEMLTLRYPFHRETLDDYFHNKEKETLLDPIKVSPQRNIPPEISRMALKCLSDSPKDRYSTFGEMISELEHCLLTLSKPIEISASQETLVNQINRYEPTDRKMHYSLILTAILQITDEKYANDINNWIQKIRLKPLYFVEETQSLQPARIRHLSIAVQLAFLLALPKTIGAILVSAIKMAATPMPILEQSLMALIELGCGQIAREGIHDISKQFLDVQAIAHLGWIKEAIEVRHQKEIQISFLDEMPKQLSISQMRPLLHIFNEALNRQETAVVVKAIEILSKKCDLSNEQHQTFVCYLLWAALLKKNWDVAKELIEDYSIANIPSEHFKFLKDCWLHVTQASYSPQLPLITNEDFLWEKRQKYRYYILYYSCTEDESKEIHYRELERKTWLNSIDN
jgi:serine/threonine protein kinase